MSKQNWKFIRNIFIVLAAAGLVILILPCVITTMYSSTRIYTVEFAPTERVAIVFGAGLTRDGQPTLILRDRVKTAVQLYFDGKVEKLLMSGDNQGIGHDEPGAMRDYAVSLGVPANAIVIDNSGDRTYDTCYRAKAIFGLDLHCSSHKHFICRAHYSYATCSASKPSAWMRTITGTGPH